MRRKLYLLAAMLIAVVMPVVANSSPASAALNCPFGGANLNNGYVCADANFITGQGRVDVKGSVVYTGTFFKLEMQTKTGMNAWVTRCTVSLRSPHFCSGTSGFATPPPNSNTQVRAKLFWTSTSYAYYTVPISQI